MLIKENVRSERLWRRREGINSELEGRTEDPRKSMRVYANWEE